MTATTTTQEPAIDVTLFDTPSGDVRGMINAFIPTKKGRTRIAHVTLLVSKPAVISASMPTRMTPDDYEKAIPVMVEFLEKVRELDTQG